MSNQHNSSNEGQLPDEGEQNPASSGYICVVILLLIPIQQPIRLAQPATDQRTVDPEDFTNEQIDDLIQRQSEHLEATIPAACWCTFILFYLLVYYCSPLLILALIVYWMTAYNNNQPTVASPESQSLYSDLPVNYAFDPYQDAEAEGRTASPTQEEIQLSTTVENLAPYGVQAALINNIPHANVIINTNNGQINPIIQNEAIVPTTTNRNEEFNFGDNVQQRDLDPTLPTIENHFVPIQNNGEINQTNTAHDQPVRTPLRNEVVEIENIASPTDDGVQALLRTTRSTGSVIPQSKNPGSPNGTSHDKTT